MALFKKDWVEPSLIPYASPRSVLICSFVLSINVQLCNRIPLWTVAAKDHWKSKIILWKSGRKNGFSTVAEIGLNSLNLRGYPICLRSAWNNVLPSRQRCQSGQFHRGIKNCNKDRMFKAPKRWKLPVRPNTTAGCERLRETPLIHSYRWSSAPFNRPLKNETFGWAGCEQSPEWISIPPENGYVTPAA